MNQIRDVHDCAFVNHPYDRVSQILRSNPMVFLEAATDGAAIRARALVASTHPSLGEVAIDRQFVVELTSIAEETGLLGPRTRLSLLWKAETHPHLLPTMVATLDLLTLGPVEAQLDFVGEYRPPHGVLGAAIDRVIGYRIVDAAVHTFLEGMAGRLRVAATE